MEINEKSYFIEKDWSLVKDNKKAKKKFKFNTFTEAFSWMTEVAMGAEKIDHHPDWTNVYNTVDVLLSTHDENKLTEKDIFLAKLMDKTFAKFE